jgi:peptidoglycan biosynthesis protein MviN/MurJ (putative lipid II flippase)
MSAFQEEYLAFGSFVISAGVIMVVVYSLTNPWWRNHIGRMMVTYAVAEILMSTLLMATIVWHVGPHWFRSVWFTLQAVVGCTFWFQTVTIIRLHLRSKRERS